MGIYIKGMEMPKSCLACDFCNPFTEKPYCRRLMKVTPKTATLPDCPLVPVPPHGRLIDADAIPYKKIMLDDDGEFYYGVTEPYIDRMPTIIEAEEGGEETEQGEC